MEKNDSAKNIRNLVFNTDTTRYTNNNRYFRLNFITNANLRLLPWPGPPPNSKYI